MDFRVWIESRIKPLDVEARAHFLAGLEIRQALGVAIHGLAGSRIAACARVASPRRKGPEPAQFEPAVIGQPGGDFIEDGREHGFPVSKSAGTGKGVSVREELGGT